MLNLVSNDVYNPTMRAIQTGWAEGKSALRLRAPALLLALDSCTLVWPVLLLNWVSCTRQCDRLSWLDLTNRQNWQNQTDPNNKSDYSPCNPVAPSSVQFCFEPDQFQPVLKPSFCPGFALPCPVQLAQLMDLLSLLRHLFIFSSPSLIWANFGPLNWAGGFLADVGFRYVPPPSLHLQRHHNLSHLVPNLVKTLLGKGLENVFQALTMFLAR